MSSRAYNEDPFHFAPLWDAILDVYDAFKRICEANNLRHYVISGTLLGAVRHGGFIPWDDDFDLAMPRSDYEKFKLLSKHLLPEHLRFVDRENTPEFEFLFGKIQDVRKAKILDVEAKVGHTLSNGIFIDIFPIDGYRNSRFSQKIGRQIEKAYRMAFALSNSPRKMKLSTLRDCWSLFLGRLAQFLFKGIGNKNVYIELTDRHIRKIPFSDNRWTGIAGIELGGFHLFFEPGLWGNATMIKFATENVPAPFKWKRYLQIHYGDYMKLPPPEKRKTTHVYDGIHVPWWLGPTRE